MKTNPSDQSLSFEHMIAQLPVGVTVLRGPEFIVEMVNDTYLQIIDRKREVFVGKPLYDTLPEVKESVDSVLTGVFRTGAPYHGFEFPAIIKRFGKRELTYFNFVYQPLLGSDGEVTGIVVIANEVTGLVKSKQLLQESEHAMSDIFLNSPFGMVILRGKDLIIEMANKTVLELWRRTNEEVSGKSILEVFPELNDQKFPELMYQVYTTGKAHKEYEAVAYIDSFDGRKTFFLDFEYAPLLDKDGDGNGIMISVHNVTERVESRKKIQKTELSLRLAVEAADMGTFDWDLKENVFVSSPRLKEIFGFEGSSDTSHEKLIAALHPEDKPARDKVVEESKKSGQLSYEARVFWPDESIHWIKVYGKILWEKDAPLRMYGTVIDITEQKHTIRDLQQSESKLKALSGNLESQVKDRTRELTQLNEDLAKSNAELAQFAYVSSHDLQEPARKIQTFISRIEDLEGQNLTGQVGTYFGRIKASAARMQRLINDLLSYSRATTSDVSLEKTDINLLLENVKGHFAEKVEELDAEITSEKIPDLRVIPFQIEQLLINLIGNSLKYAQKNIPPKIKVKTERLKASSLSVIPKTGKSTYQKISIHDNGIGFDSQFNQRIFQLFQRLHDRDEYEGTGIGLSICKKIAENHHGFILAESKINHGSVFSVYLPVE